MAPRAAWAARAAAPSSWSRKVRSASAIATPSPRSAARARPAASARTPIRITDRRRAEAAAATIPTPIVAAMAATAARAARAATAAMATAARRHDQDLRDDLPGGGARTSTTAGQAGGDAARAARSPSSSRAIRRSACPALSSPATASTATLPRPIETEFFTGRAVPTSSIAALRSLRPSSALPAAQTYMASSPGSTPPRSTSTRRRRSSITRFGRALLAVILLDKGVGALNQDCTGCRLLIVANARRCDRQSDAQLDGATAQPLKTSIASPPIRR